MNIGQIVKVVCQSMRIVSLVRSQWGPNTLAQVQTLDEMMLRTILTIRKVDMKSHGF